jgi:acetyl esterase/lipase
MNFIDARWCHRLAGAAVLVALALGVQADAQVKPCGPAPADCVGWVAVGPTAQRLRVYRSHPLDQANPGIDRALIVVHGGGRNADGIFRSGLAAAFLAGAGDTTLVVSPRFASNQGGSECRDALDGNEIGWGCAGWRWGGPAPANDAVTSFDAMDAVLRLVARKDLFPNLRAIVVAGFSAGGQYVVRYAMANKVHDALGVPVSYVVGSPSSYAYPDASRPDAGDGTFQPFIDAQNCTTYHRWPYGMQSRAGYAASLTDEQLKTQLVARPITYLLGGLDTTPEFGFDATCPAMAQGPSRLARAQSFQKLMTSKYGAKHALVVARACGHSDRCVFTADVALPLLIPKP